MNVMSDDYFGDTSDADFLALAQQFDRSGNPARGDRTGNTGSANATARPAASNLATSTSNTSRGSTERRQSEVPKVNRATPRVARPGFNAIVVNTRQVNVVDIYN